MDKIILFKDKHVCCGCGACMNICSKQAISMVEDEYGFVYPQINDSLCTQCGMCKRVCAYQNQPQKSEVKSVYAVALTDTEQLKKSASGGAFVVLANKVIKDGGIVYGSALLNEDGIHIPKHIRVDSVDDLYLLQGSKYVQSEIGDAYKQVKRDLDDDLNVLFSGTPCQCNGLKGYLQKDYNNLFLVEIICHGVPSNKLFNDFLKDYSNELGDEIKEFYFRDKSKGQGMITRAVCSNGEEVIKVGGLLAYIHFFARSYIYRINCYTCPYATKERVSDLTLGDFWGFHEEYPNYNEKNGLSNGKGISCVLINTEKGNKVFSLVKDYLVCMESTFEKVDKHNEQLHSPSKYSKRRELILDLYKRQGYAAINDYYKKNFKKDIWKYKLSYLMPKGLKRSIKKLIGTVSGEKK